jgi:hypothetical protein
VSKKIIDTNKKNVPELTILSTKVSTLTFQEHPIGILKAS